MYDPDEGLGEAMQAAAARDRIKALEQRVDRLEQQVKELLDANPR